MGDLNQLLYTKAVFRGFKGRILEVGSKNYGNTQPFRDMFKDSEYVGIDLEAGDNVDYVVNLENGVGPVAGQQFDLIIICSVLEHSSRPWVIAEHLQSVLAPEGALLSCHPWVWRYHKYPDDYFRFSPKGIMALFPKLQHWLPALYATSVQGEFVSFADNEGIDNKMALFNKAGRKHLPYLQSMMTGTASDSQHKKLLSRFTRNMKKPPAPETKP